ncbi:DUF6629 family protein [Ferruginibacter profundus]
MCFSATASFGAGTALCVVGLLSLKKVRHYKQIPFASIPLLFSIQQFSEGFVWLSLTNSSYRQWIDYSSHVFLIFAQVVWPVWVPLSIILIEKNAARKKILSAIMWMGIGTGGYLAYCLLHYTVKAEINSFHIDYSLSFPMALSWISGVFYFIPTVFPAFISSVKRMPLLGWLITISYFFTKIFYSGYLISVWCFFAAVISIVILYILTKQQVSFAGKNKIVLST